MTITAAADGSSLGNPGPTGWAWYIDDSRWAADGAPTGTNNIGELTAVAELLDATAHVDEPLHILCDSKYVIDSCTKWMRGWKYNGWKKKDGKPVLNVELMQRIDSALQGRRVTFQWVKGHAGHPENEAADERARDAATAYARGREPIRGPGFPGALGTTGGVPSDPAVGAGPGAAASRAEAAVEGTVDLADDAAELDLLDVRGDGQLALWDEEEHVATDAEIVAGLERDRVAAFARGTVSRLDELLHDDFSAIDHRGRLVTRRAVLDAAVAAADGVGRAGAEDGAAQAPNIGETMAVRALASGVQLVQYDAEVDGVAVRCAATWVFAVDAPREGRWRLRFSQSTPLS